jgi:hypothetical protein
VHGMTYHTCVQCQQPQGTWLKIVVHAVGCRHSRACSVDAVQLLSSTKSRLKIKVLDVHVSIVSLCMLS